jgi:RND superfamily putative drug exporter
MTRIARWCFVHRKSVLAGWLLVLVGVIGLGAVAGTNYNSNLSLPKSDSQMAVKLLETNFKSASGESDQIVVSTAHGQTVHSVAVERRVRAALEKVRQLPGVETVTSPYSKEGKAQISRQGTVAFATVSWDKKAANITNTEAKALIKTAETADSSDVHVSLEGTVISNADRAGTGPSVVIGIVAALIILLIIFGGAVLPSLLPLLSAIVALVIGISAVGLLTHLMTISNVSVDLTVLIGLGVGVDYGLFIISRHRTGVKAGLSYEDAAATAAKTSGRTVLFAGITVCIALLGQFALGVSFLYGLSVSAAVAVALTMATSLTLLPAMLGFLGAKTLSRRERRTLASSGPVTSERSRFWLAWARIVERHRVVAAVVGLIVVGTIALPIFGLRLGSSDAGTDPTTSTTYQAYTALAKGFGPGFNGPLELVGEVHSAADKTAFGQLLVTTSHESDVASVTAATSSPNGAVEIATVYPKTGPSAKATVSLVHELRDTVVPAREKDTSLQVHVGGVTATNIDFAQTLTDKLPVFIAIVIILAFLLLAAAFRSLLIPLVASAMNILSIGAALGIMNAVFNWGWGGSLLGLSATGPIDAFIPVLMFSVLFGLSMDYEVYLVSRMQEEWRRGQPSRLAVTEGQANSGRVIAAAAGIMISVFGAFVFGGQRAIEEFGVGLSCSILVDAFVVRGVIVPAIMHLIGPANWAMPRWLDRILPNLSVEAEEETAMPRAMALADADR